MSALRTMQKLTENVSETHSKCVNSNHAEAYRNIRIEKAEMSLMGTIQTLAKMSGLRNTEKLRNSEQKQAYHLSSHQLACPSRHAPTFLES
jgi:hypothetical protein